MEFLVIIYYHPYEICKRFHTHVSDFMVRIAGDHVKKKKQPTNILDQAKRSGKQYKHSVHRHLKRKSRKPKKHKTQKHETVKSF